jgi:AAHS family 4-hydroxybenzoate transporter-like MFS transporter
MTDVRALIDNSRVTPTQIGVITVCLLMNMLDGMDVMVISYSAPSLQEEWGIAAQSLGLIFSAALLGMAVGSFFLAPWADIIGRRKLMLICIIVMGSGVILTSMSQEVWHLVVLRFVSGLGIGAMIASTVTLASEYAPDRQKNFFVGFVLTGYPIGATLSGLVAAQIIPEYGWRAMFIFAGGVTIIALPLAWFLLSESWEWLLKKQPDGALEKLNLILRKMDQPPLDQLPEKSPEANSKPGIGALLTPERKDGSIKLWIAFFLGFATLYFLTTWIPNLARYTGLSIELAIYAGTVFNLGAIFGNMSQGYLSQLVGLRRSILLYYLGTAILMTIFGYLSGNWVILITFGIIGFGIQGGLVGLYAVGTRLYPVEVRNTGIGLAVGAGRVGAILSPTIGGTLVGAGVTLSGSMLIFAGPLIIVVMSIWMIKTQAID